MISCEEAHWHGAADDLSLCACNIIWLLELGVHYTPASLQIYCVSPSPSVVTPDLKWRCL